MKDLMIGFRYFVITLPTSWIRTKNQIGIELRWMKKMTDKLEEFKKKVKNAEDDPLIDSLIEHDKKANENTDNYKKKEKNTEYDTFIYSLIEHAKKEDENTDYYEAVKILKYEIVKRLENKRKEIWWGSVKLPFLF